MAIMGMKPAQLAQVRVDVLARAQTLARHPLGAPGRLFNASLDHVAGVAMFSRPDVHQDQWNTLFARQAPERFAVKKFREAAQTTWDEQQPLSDSVSARAMSLVELAMTDSSQYLLEVAPDRRKTRLAVVAVSSWYALGRNNVLAVFDTTRTGTLRVGPREPLVVRVLAEPLLSRLSPAARTQYAEILEELEAKPKAAPYTPEDSPTVGFKAGNNLTGHYLPPSSG
jgi:hypothetical protein